MKTTGSTLDEIPAGSHVFVDAMVFVYHFAGASRQCRRLLERCERGEVIGVTSVVVLAEATHRLMMLEAVRSGRVSPGGVARKLREHPEAIRSLHEYRDQVESIATWGIDVVSLDLGGCQRAAEIRARHGLLTNDSLVVAALQERGISVLASGDTDLRRVPGIAVHAPADLGGS
jgi:predicted nucleic acid-binding protein